MYPPKPSNSRLPFIAIVLALATVLSSVAAEESSAPWIGSLGVTEITSDLMARDPDYLRPPRTGRRHRKHLLGRRDWERLVQAPGAVELEADGGPTIEAAQSQGLSFIGATLSDTFSFPPDSMGAAGPSQYIVAVNGRIRSFNKQTGTQDNVMDANPDVFFSSVMTPPATNNFTSDPRIRYDRLSGRWFIIIIDVPERTGSAPNRILFAVSGASIIGPSTPWTFFQFRHDLPTPTSKTDNNKFADYPSLGIDAQALYIGVNIFGTRGQGSFSGTTAFVVRKSSILGAGPIVVTPFRDLVGNGLQGGPYTPQGVDNFDPGANEGYFIGVDSAYYGRLNLLRVSNPGGNPTMSGTIQITVPATGGTMTVPHLGNTGGSSGNLDGLDYRLMAAHIRNGRLWTCANIAVDNTGSPSGVDTRMGIRWYELGGVATGQAPAIIQSGTIFQPSASNDTGQRHYWMGTVMVSGQGHALLGFSAAGANETINAGYAGRLVGDPLGTFRTPVLYTSSSASYNPPSNPGGASGRRWGDYSYTSLDPNDDMTMWTIQEWCHANNSYAVQVVKVLAPPPATPLAANPSTLSPGQNNIAVSLTGSSVDGSGFFDPGPGFSNRISAAVSGTGVTVTGITYNNPTNLTLLVSVAPNAAAGSRSLSVTNPDGQIATTASLLTVTSSVQTNRPPVLAALSNQVITEETLLSVTPNANDPDGDTLAFAFASVAPPGAAINLTNGVFTWSPSEAQGPSTNPISIRVSDSGAPTLSATQSFTVFVLESNRPPVLTVIPARTIHAGTQVSFTNSASDPDIPANGLTFDLPSASSGWTLNPTSGIFNWPTSDDDAGTTNQIQIRVSDNGSPVLSHTQNANIIVLAKPLILSVQPVTNSFELTWSSIPGTKYRIQKTENLHAPAWADASASIEASDWTVSAHDIAPAPNRNFYRIRVE